MNQKLQSCSRRTPKSRQFPIPAVKCFTISLIFSHFRSASSDSEKNPRKDFNKTTRKNEVQ